MSSLETRSIVSRRLIRSSKLDAPRKSSSVEADSPPTYRSRSRRARRSCATPRFALATFISRRLRLSCVLIVPGYGAGIAADTGTAIKGLGSTCGSRPLKQAQRGASGRLRSPSADPAPGSLACRRRLARPGAPRSAAAAGGAASTSRDELGAALTPRRASARRRRARWRSTSSRAASSSRTTLPSAFVPASNEKLPVTYAALKVLGPRFRFPTEVRGAGLARRRRDVDGNLVLKGYGDPTLSTSLRLSTARAPGPAGSASARVTGWSSATSRSSTSCAPLRAGRRRSTSRSRRRSQRSSSTARGRGSATRRTPAYTAADALRSAADQGGRARSPARRARSGPAARCWPSSLSQPLERDPPRRRRHSDNFSAELLLKELGAVAGTGGTTAAGAPSSSGCSRRTGSRSPASRSPTARASRRSTG